METQRISLSVPKITEANFFIQLMNSPGWLEFIGNRNIHTTKDSISYIESLIKNNNKLGFCLNTIYLKNTNTPIGICGLIKRDYLVNPDLGFAILPEYQGKGYIKESARLWIKYAKESLNLKHLEAITNPDNYTSIRLLESLGFLKYSAKSEQANSLLFCKSL